MIKSKHINSTKPFLRWAGGKTWLIKYLDKIIGEIKFKNYHEPFLGSGAIFFALHPTNKIYLSDLNRELIETYATLRDMPQDIINILEKLENTEECYYRVRSETELEPAKKAARFIYLNQTSYNGIYRVNLKGIYNVPYGYRDKPFLEKERLTIASYYLQSATIACDDFNMCQANISENDLVFLDPPYTVSHNNNGFIKYNQKLFSLDDQIRLRQLVDIIKEKNAYYILTNAAHPVILEIFDAGDRVIELSRASLIGGQNAKRGQVSEYIFTNIPGGEV